MTKQQLIEKEKAGEIKAFMEYRINEDLGLAISYMDNKKVFGFYWMNDVRKPSNIYFWKSCDYLLGNTGIGHFLVELKKSKTKGKYFTVKGKRFYLNDFKPCKQ